MKKIKNTWTYSILLLGIALFFIGGCKKDSSNSDPAQSTGISFNSKLTYGTVTDIDGNVYKTITIGTQTWMAENLRVTRYRNGDTINLIPDETAWYNQTSGASCFFSNSASKGATYGKLYNWYSLLDTRGLCPTGWHVPTDAEWEALYAYLGGYVSETSHKMREIGTAHWAYLNDGATNESGFTALPGGMRDYGGLFTDIGQMGFWWSSAPSGDYYNLDAVYYYLDDSGVNQGVGSKKNGMSVRCVKD